MKPFEFDTGEFGVHTWVMYQGVKKYVISLSFPERLFALVPDKSDFPPDEWTWVRCENVELIKSEVINFPKK